MLKAAWDEARIVDVGKNNQLVVALEVLQRVGAIFKSGPAFN